MSVPLSDLLERHPNIRLASKEDNDTILKFFDETPMEGTGLVLRYERSPDFFKFLEFQSPHHFVFLMEIKGDLKGVGTLVIRPGMINGKSTYVGYLGDLRTKFDRRAVVVWRRFYDDLIKSTHQIDEFFECKYLLTAIIDENTAAINALVKNEKLPFRYVSKTPYCMNSIFLRYFQKTQSNFSVSRATEKNKTEILEFLSKQHQDKAFGYCFNSDHNELEFRLSYWPNFDWDKIVIVKDKEKIVGISCLWSPSPSKKIVVEKMPLSQSLFLKMVSPFKNVAKLGEELKVLYLTLTTFDKEMFRDKRDQAFQALVNHVYDSDEIKNYHLIGHCDFYRQFPLSSGLNNFVVFKTPMTLYQVVDKNHQDQFEVQGELPTGFEMALV